jgi:glutaconate CoA-transferase subunit A
LVTGAGTARRSKLASLADAVAVIRDGDHVAIGGIWSHNSPAALVRALVRRGATGLTISAGPAAGFAVDLVIAAGCVRRALLPNVTFEHLGLAPAFRAAVQSGELELIECDEPTLVGGYRAAAAGLPSQPVQSVRGTALAEARPDLSERRIGDWSVLDVAAIVPDVVLLHAGRGDEYGNLQQSGSVFADRLLAKAAGRAVLASVDELITNEAVRRAPSATTVPSHLVTAVVETAYGAHPCSSHDRYRADEEHLAAYSSSISGHGWMDYRERYVAPDSQPAYLDAVGGTAVLSERLGLDGLR